MPTASVRSGAGREAAVLSQAEREREGGRERERERKRKRKRKKREKKEEREEREEKRERERERERESWRPAEKRALVWRAGWLTLDGLRREVVVAAEASI